MELRHLRYFQKVAELQHFRKSADFLCITQPALSNTIKQLEEELGTQLFIRIGRNVKLSESGEIVLSTAKRILNEVALLKETVQELESGQTGSLNVGVLQSINALYLRSLVIEFDKTHPNISLRIEEMSNSEIFEKVASGELDVGIGFILKKENSKVELEKVFDESWKLILSPEHASLAKEIMAGKKHKLKAVMLPEKFETRRILEQYFRNNDIQYNNMTVVNTISSILELVKNSASFTILPEAFSALKASHNLETFTLTPKLEPRTIGIVTGKGRVRKKVVEEFSYLVKKQLG